MYMHKSLSPKINIWHTVHIYVYTCCPNSLNYVSKNVNIYDYITTGQTPFVYEGHIMCVINNIEHIE